MWPHDVSMESIVDEIASRDKRLAEVIAEHPLCDLGVIPQSSSNFESLVESVIAQQLSVKSANAIFGRLQALSDGEVRPERVSKLDDSALRDCGLSGSKTRTIRGLAEAFLSGLVDFESLHLFDDDDQVSEQLNSLWGIGPWTVDMFMMNRLGRLDIWPVGDLGVRRGWETIYGLDEQIDPAVLHQHGEAFRPYRSVVAWYCWVVWD
ncbi:MAG: DNA-3-methyladenine glycosylase family protein [Microbacteriaceae bacterium]